ncbi:nitrilase-related carbon-nitrogen hydrolase [uncultured Fibrobacter sp.]|jgi:Predicted amidohydrolase|uniref:nitrilase-related carbon-nitrogen hydrolase n=1 Tax=uncultured Fibrobacter sp. TaxID=261512 RepID=UPI0025EAA141|nr:nitrilase-related carbon-nitrogen hydrolase [uncultured Fibrobacter sp.]
MQNVYLVQMESIPGEKAHNLAHAVSLVESADVKSGGIILFPEMFATGYLPKDPACEAENFEDGNGETASVLSDLANKTGCTIFGAGIAKKGNAITNHSSVYVPAQQSEFAGYDKIHPFFHEQESFRAGESVTLFKINGWRIAPTICYDLRFPETYREAVRQGTDLFTIQAAWPKSRVAHFEALLRARAIENQCYVAAVNACGRDAGGNPYAGHSVILDPEGNVVAAANDTETVLEAEIDLERVKACRALFPVLKDAGIAV